MHLHALTTHPGLVACSNRAPQILQVFSFGLFCCFFPLSFHFSYLVINVLVTKKCIYINIAMKHVPVLKCIINEYITNYLTGLHMFKINDSICMSFWVPNILHHHNDCYKIAYWLYELEINVSVCMRFYARVTLHRHNSCRLCNFLVRYRVCTNNCRQSDQFWEYVLHF